MTNPNPVFIPGPTNTPDRIRRAIDVQTQDHRAPDFIELFRPVFADVKAILKTTDAEVFLFPSTGTGGWEAAITNTLSPGDRILISRYGHFSARWIDLCQRHGLDVQIIEEQWGNGAPAEKFESVLTQDTAHKIKAVLATHNETATGVKSDIAAIRKAINASAHSAMLFVDGVSSIASMDFRMDEWGVDIAITGSQKGFMLPPGLAIIGVSQKAMQAHLSAQCHRCFFDFTDMKKANDAGLFPYTPPTGLIYGLKESIKMLNQEGLENVFKRHYRLAQGVRLAAEAWGLRLCANDPSLYSDSVSAICVPEGFDSTELVSHAYDKYSVSFGIGLGEVNGKVFRIGHLGQLTDVMVLAGLATAEMAMMDLGYSIELGSGVAAAQDYYRNNALY